MPERPRHMVLPLIDVFSVSSALRDPDLDVEIRALLGYRAWHMCVEHEAAIGDDVRLFVIDPGDYPEAINLAVGFAVTGENADLVDLFSVEDHGLYLEATYLPDDGPHTRLFLRNDDGLEMGLHLRCLSHLWQDGVGEGA